jgi:hypothetical protein
MVAMKRSVLRPSLGALTACAILTHAIAQGEKTTTLHIVVVETHDRLTPTPKPGIVKRHEATIVLHPDKRIEQVFENQDVTNRVHQDPGGEHSAWLGVNDGKTAWHVLGPNKLQRFWQDYELLVVWTIDIRPNRACSIDAKYLLRAGSGVTAGKIAGTDINATFNNYRVLDASCAVE